MIKYLMFLAPPNKCVIDTDDNLLTSVVHVCSQIHLINHGFVCMFVSEN